MSRAISQIRTGCFRRLSAVFLAVLYLAIALVPLAPAALHSKAVTHAVTGECVGDCAICGCSPESSSGKTCCCARKLRMSQQCSTPAAKSCCPVRSAAAAPTESATEKRTCSTGNTGDIHDDHSASGQDQDRRKVAVLKCGCPCGKGKLLALNATGTNELLPGTAPENIVLPHLDTCYTSLTQRMTSRHAEPPDPPPRIAASA